MARRGVAPPQSPESSQPPGRSGKSSRPGPRPITLLLLGGFQLEVDGKRIHLALGECRLLVAVALRDRAQTRATLAGQLWPDVTNDRALRRLRTALWRLHQTGWLLVTVTPDEVALGPEVEIDVRELIELSHRPSDTTTAAGEARLEQLAAAGELLPDWDDDWLVTDRERIRQIRLHALEQLSGQFADEGRFGPAVEAALTAVAEDPLRESARRTLIRILMAEGNVHDALAQYEEYRDVMRDDLGLDPSPQMEALLRELGIDRSQRRAQRDASAGGVARG
jgi:DNA-binding SARP family transcriptional activator